MIILVDRKILKQIPAQYPIIFPPIRTIFCGKNKDGRNISEINIMPTKKNDENKKFLIIFVKNYIKSFRLCLLLITLIFDFLISNSVGFGRKL